LHEESKAPIWKTEEVRNEELLYLNNELDHSYYLLAEKLCHCVKQHTLISRGAEEEEYVLEYDQFRDVAVI
jgi:hypothetical protein